MKVFNRGALFLLLSSLLSLLPACGKQLVEFGKADGPRADVANNDRAPTDLAGTDVAGTDVAGTDVPRADVATDIGGADARDAINPDLANNDGGADVRDAISVDLGIDGVNVDVSVDLNVDLNVSVDLNVDLNIDAVNPDVNVDAGAQDGACAQAPVVLGAALENFVVLAGPTVTNTGLTVVTGDLGTSPGAAIVGFGPGVVVGTQHAGDGAAALAQAALTIAYNDAAGRVLCPVSVSGNLGGMTLTPGLYKSTGALEITSGDLMLDAQGNPNAVFIFQMATTLNTSSGRQVLLSGLAKSANVFWQVGSSATLGSTSVFQGTIMADQAIAMMTGATLNGRALARIAGITLDTNAIVRPTP